MASFAMLEKEDPEVINTFFDTEAGEKLTVLCKELFGSPKYAMDDVYLPGDVRERIKYHYTRRFFYISLEGLQHELREFFCIHTDSSDSELQAFFDDCYELHDLVEKRIKRLKRFFF